MDMYPEYKSPLGYKTGDNKIDSYGVDHSKFSLRDEVEYQFARDKREQELINQYNSQGITSNYPQYGTNFWGNSDNNYGFGTSDISKNIENVTGKLNNNVFGQNENFSVSTNIAAKPVANVVGNNQTVGSTEIKNTDWYNSIEAQKKAERDAVNQILMNGMDVLYGMNRTVNGMTFGGLDWLGNKLGYDTQMNDYLQMKSPQEREFVQTVGKLAQYGGGVLTGGRALTSGRLAKEGINQANIAYNGYKIGKKYDKLIENPFQGSGQDIIVTMKNHNGEPVVLQRGEVMRGDNGEIIAAGKPLLRECGTEKNYGLNKAIYKHDVPKNEATRMPRYIQNQPVDVSPRGQYVYEVSRPDGRYRVVVTPTENGRTISSMYKIEK